MTTTRTRLLEALQAGSQDWISGETLSVRLRVSRAAIHKHIKRLRQDGYRIESLTKKGYRLGSGHDLITREALQAGLQTRIIGHKDIHIFKQTDSTNLQAKELAAAGAPEGSLVIAEAQSAGRGRKGRQWYSPPGTGIYLSLILRPAIAPMQTQGITLMSAVAAADFLSCDLKIPIRIKWPNDLLINGKKLAGILTEISTEMDAVDYIVVGIGLNVNTLPNDLPRDLRHAATSLRMLCGKEMKRVSIIQGYLNRFEQYYDQFKEHGFSEIRRIWKEYCELINKEVTIRKLKETITGTVADIDDTGVLLLKDASGTIHRIFSGDLIVKNRYP